MTVPGALALSDLSGMDGALHGEEKDKLGRKNDRRAHKACLLCRQIHKRCDGTRPCQTCVWRGRSRECVDDSKAGSCVVCKKRKVKCDMQRPCSRCVRLKREDACVSADHGIDEPASSESLPEAPLQQRKQQPNFVGMMSPSPTIPDAPEKPRAIQLALSSQMQQLQAPLQFPATTLLPQAVPCLDFPIHLPVMSAAHGLPQQRPPPPAQQPQPQAQPPQPQGMQNLHLPSLALNPPPALPSNILGLLVAGTDPNLLAQLVTSTGLPSSVRS